MREHTEMRRIKIFDTTLRDGEQSPGFSMSLNQKLRIAHVLAELNVDVLEAGFPAASPGDFESGTVITRSPQIESPSANVPPTSTSTASASDACMCIGASKLC